jgi:hypothetical protein
MQNNSRNKASKCGGGKQGASVKSDRVITNVFNHVNFKVNAGLEVDLPSNIYIGRITKKCGDGVFQVIYTSKKKHLVDDLEISDKDKYELVEAQASVPGKFKGRSKRAVFFDVNKIVIIDDGFLAGIMERDELKDISKKIYIHPQVMAENQASREDNGIGPGIEFGDESEEETVIVSKKDKEKHNRQNIPTSVINIDDI